MRADFRSSSRCRSSSPSKREATIPGAAGELGILPGHAPLLGEVGAGELRYTLSTGEKQSMVVFGGWIEVNSDIVRVLAQSAERVNEIDVARAEAAFKRAVERSGRIGTDQVDLARALNAMKRAKARLDAAKAWPDLVGSFKPSAGAPDRNAHPSPENSTATGPRRR